MGICAAHRVQAAKRGDQHQQRRLRQVEVGEQAVDDAEAMAGNDETARPPLTRELALSGEVAQ